MTIQGVKQGKNGQHIELRDETTGRMVARDPKERFMDKVKVDEETGCWVWQSTIMPNGYGYFWFQHPNYPGKMSHNAHRASWLLFKGDTLPPVVMHICDNKPCVNPNHLRGGTTQDNVTDRVSKGRGANGEKNGSSKLQDAQVLAIRTKYDTGEFTHRELALQFGVSTALISSIINKKSWKHLP
jgi:hypothetical protein